MSGLELFLVLIFGLSLSAKGFTIEPTLSEAPFVSLYSQSDEVIDLTDDTINNAIYNSDSLWLVQFYSHWCGHCQRFAPTWTSLAADIKDWSPTVKVAAINCAEQSCDKYQVRFTPTVRIFLPETIPNKMDSSFYGFDIPVKKDLEYFKSTVIYNLHRSVDLGKNIQVQLKPLRQSPDPSEMYRLFDSLPHTVHYVGLIFENQFSGNTGEQVILDLNQHSDLVKGFKVDSTDPQVAKKWKLTGSRSTLVVVDRNGQEVDRLVGRGREQTDRKRFTTLLNSYVEGNSGVTEYPAATLPVTSNVQYTVPDKVIVNKPDEVYLGDLEKALEYSLMKEVAMQPLLDTKKLQALVYFLETVLQFYPGGLRLPVRQFIIGLREWPVQMRFAAVSHNEYKAKVEELSQFYQPWKSTPNNFVGCAGSQPRFRGYPCSLWSLFHALTVSASDKDPAFMYNKGLGVSTVANAMIGYIQQFFSCRECAVHFSSHVAAQGFLPHSGDQSILWLWSIHNKANNMLTGDPTEDPDHPKINWPSSTNCPSCKVSNDRWNPLVRVNGEYWNQKEVVNYIKTVYRSSSMKNNIIIKDNINETVSSILERLRRSTTLNDNWEKYYQEANQQLSTFCSK